MPEADAENEARRLGDVLRDAREARGLSLEDASQTTKISRNYLVALENGAFDTISSPAYVKGFLRVYAGFLGLSPQEVVAQYEATVPKPPPGEVEAEAPRIEMVERVKFGGHGRWAIPALLLCLVVLAARFFSDGGEQRERPPVPRPAKQAPAPSKVVVAPPPPAAAPVLPPRTSAAAVATTPLPAGTAQHEAVSTPVSGGGVMLRLRFNRDSWLDITIDNSVSQHYDLKAGDIIEWKGERLFSVDVGDGGAVEAEFNGKPVRALGESGKPVHVEFKGVGE